jgi:hypothetical protein
MFRGIPRLIRHIPGKKHITDWSFTRLMWLFYPASNNRLDLCEKSLIVILIGDHGLHRVLCTFLSIGLLAKWWNFHSCIEPCTLRPPKASGSDVQLPRYIIIDYGDAPATICQWWLCIPTLFLDHPCVVVVWPASLYTFSSKLICTHSTFILLLSSEYSVSLSSGQFLYSWCST